MNCDRGELSSLALEFELEQARREAGVGLEGLLGLVLHVALRAPRRPPLAPREHERRRLGGGGAISCKQNKREMPYIDLWRTVVIVLTYGMYSQN